MYIKRTFLFLFLLYHTSAYCFNVGSLWQKKEMEKVNKEYQLNDIKKIVIYNTEGSIQVKPWSQPKIAIEAIKKGTKEEIKQTTVSFKAGEKEAQLTTKVPDNQKSANVEYIIMVPANASLKITQTDGKVSVKGVSGPLDVSLETGSIDVSGSSKAVTAKVGTGSIKVKQNSLPENQSIFLETLTGSITLLLPRETAATLRAKVTTGTITSDHLVTLSPRTIKLDKEGWEDIKKSVEGSLGGSKGGAPITLEVMTGSISIKES